MKPSLVKDCCSFFVLGFMFLRKTNTRQRLTLLSTFLLLTFNLSPFSLAQPLESRYPEGVRYLVNRGVLQGQNGSLNLQQEVTRAELAVIAYRLKGAAQPSGVRCFSDVAPEAWYRAAVCSLAGQRIISGFEDGTFRPTQAVQGAEVLKVIMAAFNVSVDSGDASPWYTPYVQLASELGLTGLEPLDAVTRDDLAQFIFSLYKLRAAQQKVSLTSSGCGLESPVITEVASSGVSRSVITALPETYDNQTPYDLIFAFHGRTSDNTQVQRYYDLEPSPNSIIAYPQALSDGSGFNWGNGESFADTVLFDDLLETYASNYCVDLASVFIVGHSLGASYATSLACLRGDKIRAVAALGGGISASGCSSKVAAMILHNPEDNLVPLSEGERARDTFLAQNGLPPEPAPTEPAAFNCNRYGSEETLYPVVWCLQPISTEYDGSYYPHIWPDGVGPAILEFFEGL
jgi:polyhydroxybutyrate depolymerase